MLKKTTKVKSFALPLVIEPKKGFVGVGIIILVLVLLATTGYFAYQNMQTQNQTTAKTTPTPTTDETANSKQNYVPGELIVGFKEKITLEQAKNTIQKYNLNVKQEIYENVRYLVIYVPKEQEQDWINKLKQDPNIKNAWLNGISTRQSQ